MRGIEILRLSRGGATLTLVDANYIHFVIDPNDAEVTLSLTTTGFLVVTGDVPSNYRYLENGNAADYEVLFETVSGTPSSGTANVWQQINATRSVGVSRTVLGTKEFSFMLKIGRVGTSTALEAATITISVSVEV